MPRSIAPHRVALLLALLGLAGPGPANPTPQSVLDAAPATAWRDIPADELMVMTLGDGSVVTIRLAPAFAPVHVANIRTLVRAGWFDAGAIIRVQDNYVVQWAQGDEKRALPPGIVAVPPAEYERPAAGLRVRPLGQRDSYARMTGLSDGWPIGGEGNTRWLAHCYGMVGVGRDNAPDTGSGSELYAVIGHAPRQLDRNIALVGRVIGGIETMAARPRGTGPLGFYQTPAERVPIVSARIAADLPLAERPAWQILDSDGATFTAWVTARANRKDDFYVRPAAAVDLCNAVPPTRRKP